MSSSITMTSALTWGLWLFLFSTASEGKYINSYAGPFIAYIMKMESCSYPRGSLIMNLRLSTLNRFRPYDKQTITGNFTLLEDVDDYNTIQANFAKRSNNEWKKNFLIFSYPGGTCISIRDNVPIAFRTVFKPKKMTGPCLVRAGTYTLNGEEMDWTTPNIPQLPYGHYLLNITAFKRESGRPMFTLCSELKIIPKP